MTPHPRPPTIPRDHYGRDVIVVLLRMKLVITTTNIVSSNPS